IKIKALMIEYQGRTGGRVSKQEHDRIGRLQRQVGELLKQVDVLLAELDRLLDVPPSESGHATASTQKRDEVAPLHCLMLHVFSTERIAQLRTAGACCTAGFDQANDRCGSDSAVQSISAAGLLRLNEQSADDRLAK